MTTNHQTSIASLAKNEEHTVLNLNSRSFRLVKHRTFQLLRSLLQHGLNTNLVSKWIRLIDAKPGNDRSPLPNKPAFIALSCSAPLDPTPTDMLTVQITFTPLKSRNWLEMASIRNICFSRITQGTCNMIRIDEIWFLPNPGYASRDGYCHGSGGESLWLHQTALCLPVL